MGSDFVEVGSVISGILLIMVWLFGGLIYVSEGFTIGLRRGLFVFGLPLIIVFVACVVGYIIFEVFE